MAGKTAKAVVDASGRWQTKLGPIAAGGPYEFIVTGPTSRKLSDVLVGDVWLCGGQSNMEFALNGTNHATEEVAAANHPNIRLFHVPQRISPTPLPIVDAEWNVCTPQTAAGFSAVARVLHRASEDERAVAADRLFERRSLAELVRDGALLHGSS